MNIIPAIDLYNGKVVRLKQGDFADPTFYMRDPLELIQEYEEGGFARVHVVDLSGAEQGQMQQEKLLQKLCAKSKIKIQVGGGLRNIEQIERLFDAGVDRVVIGSLSVDDPARVQQWLKKWGPERIVIAIDVLLQSDVPIVMTRGWKENTSLSLSSLLSLYADSGLENVLCTDIERDGLLQGPNVELYAQLVKDYSAITWIASGGVSNMDDLRTLNAVGLQNVVVGKALYEQRLNLKQCQEVMQW